MISKTEEQELVNSAIKGNQNAFRYLYQQYVDQLFRFLLQFSENRQEVQDWTQRAFIKAFTRLNTFKMQSRFKTWLFTIAINEMKMDRRSDFEFTEFSESTYPNDSENFISDIEDSENWIKTKTALKQLQPLKRIVFLLHVAEGYTHEHISEILSIKEGASRTILHRAKKELQNLI